MENLEQSRYISERLEEFVMNINEFSIDETVVDSKGKKYLITNKTSNSIEVYITKNSKEGVNCNQWFDMKHFNKRFKKYKH